MIIARSPLRVSLGGGGTDLPSYSNRHGGFVLSAAIDKYVYATVMRPFSEGIYLKYSQLEKVNKIDEIQHPIIREALHEMKLRTPQIEISTLADIPSGTGLGSSGSFTTALLRALHAHYRMAIDVKRLAELACEIELDRLNEPIGKQDQYISAYGGISSFEFHKDGTVTPRVLPISTETLHELEDNLLLFFTGVSRSASEILRDQDEKSRQDAKSMIENLHFTKELGLLSQSALLDGDLDYFAELMHQHWTYKKTRSPGITSLHINSAYDAAMENGAMGGKIVGAGGGGFLMFLAGDKARLRKKMSQMGLQEVRFKFDFEGAKVILS